MPSKTIEVIIAALSKQKDFEENARRKYDRILESLADAGIRERITRIRDDEIQHARIVQGLIDRLEREG